MSFSRHLLLALAAALALPGCAPKATPPPFDRITLERMVCFGRCPLYQIAVYGDGRVQYLGKSNVKVAGADSARLTPDQLRKLGAALKAAGYFALHDRYAGPADGCPAYHTDAPTVQTSVTVAGATKTIAHNHGCMSEPDSTGARTSYPQPLTTFEDQIDEIVGTARWVGTPAEREQHQGYGR